MFLARKISRAKWEVKRDLSEGEISADAVTADLPHPIEHAVVLAVWYWGRGRN